MDDSMPPDGLSHRLFAYCHKGIVAINLHPYEVPSIKYRVCLNMYGTFCLKNGSPFGSPAKAVGTPKQTRPDASFAFFRWSDRSDALPLEALPRSHYHQHLRRARERERRAMQNVEVKTWLLLVYSVAPLLAGYVDC